MDNVYVLTEEQLSEFQKHGTIAKPSEEKPKSKSKSVYSRTPYVFKEDDSEIRAKCVDEHGRIEFVVVREEAYIPVHVSLKDLMKTWDGVRYRRKGKVQKVIDRLMAKMQAI